MISPRHSVLLVHMQMRQGFMKSEMGVNRMTERAFTERVRALEGPLWRIAWAMLRNGADFVIYPEMEAAVSIAVSESSDDIFDCIPMTAEYSIYELKVPDRWVGKSILELSVRSKYHRNILGLKTGGVIQPMPGADHVFKADEHVMVMGLVEDVRRLVH